MQTGTKIASHRYSAADSNFGVSNQNRVQRLRLLSGETYPGSSMDLASQAKDHRISRGHASLNHQTLLSIGDDIELLETRQMVLESAGYLVHSMSSKCLIKDDRKHSIPLAILCHTVPPERASAIRASLRRLNPQLLVLQLKAFGTQALDDDHHLIELQDVPVDLLRTIKRLLNDTMPESIGSSGDEVSMARIASHREHTD